MIEIIKAARTNLANQIKKMITDSQSIRISALDACRCTGNCAGIKQRCNYAQGILSLRLSIECICEVAY